ncbi:hypothetical protein LXL04_029206 [Taraxacum kok-saghyz]
MSFNSTLHKAPLPSSLPLSRHLSAVLFHPTSTHSRQAKLRIHGWDPTSATNIHFHEFKTPNFESPPPDPNASNKFPSHLLPSFQLPSHLREPFAKLLAEIAPTTRRVVIIHDYLMSSVVQDVVSYENAESYVFHGASAFTTFSYIWEANGSPSLDDTESYMQLTKVPALEGIITEVLKG